VLVCLAASPEVIFKRVGGATNRPLLKVPDPMAKINELLNTRAPYYKKADITIDTSELTVEETADEIIRRVRE
jgi:shikimate kinase